MIRASRTIFESLTGWRPASVSSSVSIESLWSWSCLWYSSLVRNQLDAKVNQGSAMQIPKADRAKLSNSWNSEVLIWEMSCKKLSFAASKDIVFMQQRQFFVVAMRHTRRSRLLGIHRWAVTQVQAKYDNISDDKTIYSEYYSYHSLNVYVIYNVYLAECNGLTETERSGPILHKLFLQSCPQTILSKSIFLDHSCSVRTAANDTWIILLGT